MRVVSINQEYRDKFPVWVYHLKIDPEQSERLVRDWDRTQPSEYIVFDEFKFCTEAQLVIGVGDLFTPDLVPADVIPETDEERELRERREVFLQQLGTIGRGFFVMRGDDED
jgi:hypothetical protein